MSYTAPTLSVLISRVRGDIQSALTYAPDGSLRPVPYLLMVLCRDGIGTAVAGVAWGLHKGLEYVAAQVTPATATEQNLDNHGQPVNRFRRAASATRLTVRIWGTAGSVIPSTAYLQRSDGARYNLLSGGHTFATNGYWDTTVEAAVPGKAGNTAAGVLLALASPPAGVNGACEVLAQVLAGIDAETDEVYRPDVIAGYQGAGAGGGTILDWWKWAKEVPGVAGALAGSSAAGTVQIAAWGDGGTPLDPATVTELRNHLTANYKPVDCRMTVESVT